MKLLRLFLPNGAIEKIEEGKNGVTKIFDDDRGNIPHIKVYKSDGTLALIKGLPYSLELNVDEERKKKEGRMKN